MKPAHIPTYCSLLHLHLTNFNHQEGKAEVGGSIFNLVKNIVGSGILALPGGVAAFSHARGAVVPASVLILLLGLLSGYCFSLIGRACAATNARSYGDAWAATVEPKTVWMPLSSVVAKTFFTCLSYSIIIGDTFAALAQTFAAPAWLAYRPTILSAISGVFLLPLCLMTDLSPLRYTSIVGIAGTLYTAGVMALRYFDGSYALGGRFFNAAASAAKGPLFTGSAALNPLSLILVSMLSTSFIAHYNAPKFYHELKDKTVPKYNTVVGTSFGASILLFVVMTVFPFLTFGGHSSGLILNNYANGDNLATMCRLAIGASIVFGYPLTFITTREGVFSALGVTKPTKTQIRVATVAILSALTGCAMVLRNLGFVVAFGGALLGSAIIYVFPAVMWVGKCKGDMKRGDKLTGWRKVNLPHG
ncbi:transmembrane amino acid transporter protein-domain-containing protein [Tribonema minus]|uniref:Transmembrane amino acid transporter protein-domain-containing protein n=1 Tax=Tribonema minus TaxID=303371 RepID=A0A836CMH1_9STRA|nr:transmembrane amino acid transporter protein-domain-containing protein [Tribonema minus]